jgi:uncharacterized protein (TIGR00255 family)
MIFSMTGFAAGNRDLGHASIQIELKSVNSRYLDLAFRVGEEMRGLEMPFRELISSRIQRGKVECRVYLQTRSGSDAAQMSPNLVLVEKLLAAANAIQVLAPAAKSLTVSDLLRWPGVLAEQAVDPDAVNSEAKALMGHLLDEFVATRAREGDKLAAVLLDRSGKMRQLVAEVQPLIPLALAEYQDRIATKLREAVANLDEDRIRQELSVFAVKIDVEEELARLVTHLDEVERVLKKGGAVGKRLDFLMQELNREANTLASKAVSSAVSKIALELKLLIEQMREQVQNLE